MDKRIRDRIKELTRLGVYDDMPPHDAKHIVLANTISVAALALSAIYLIPNSLAPLPLILKVCPVAFAAAYTLPLWLNHRGLYPWAIAWLFTVGALSQVAFVFIYGYPSGNQYFFLPILSAIFLVFPSRYAKTALVLAGATIATFVLLLAFGPDIDPLVALDEDTINAYFLLALVSVAILIAAISYYAQRSTVEAERQVEQRSNQLAAALHRLQESQALLIESENQARLARVVSGILHEINTPLGALSSSADSLDRTLQRCREVLEARAHPEDHESRRTLRAFDAGSDLSRVIQDGSGRIARVVADLRRFVALDEADKKAVDVRESMDSALSVLRSSLGEHVRIIRRYSESLPAVVCQPSKLNQAFFSILENSVHAIEEQGVIEVSVKEDGGRVEVEIVDDGKGIPAEMVPQLFEITLSQKGERVGMRLGLPLSKRNVDEMGGELILESTVGRGTTVRILLPAA